MVGSVEKKGPLRGPFSTWLLATPWGRRIQVINDKWRTPILFSNPFSFKKTVRSPAKYDYYSIFVSVHVWLASFLNNQDKLIEKLIVANPLMWFAYVFGLLSEPNAWIFLDLLDYAFLFWFVDVVWCGMLADLILVVSGAWVGFSELFILWRDHTAFQSWSHDLFAQEQFFKGSGCSLEELERGFDFKTTR